MINESIILQKEKQRSWKGQTVEGKIFKQKGKDERV